MAGEAVTKTIKPGDTQQFAPRSSGIYRFQVKQGQMRMNDNRNEVRNGDLGVPGDRGRVELERGDQLWVKNVGLNEAKVEFNRQGLQIEFFPNSKLEVTDKVYPGLETDTITSSSAGQTLSFKDQDIPQGAKMTIKPDPQNSGDILINGEFLVDPSYSTPVSNMQVPDIKFTDSGDSAQAVVEVDS
ncbi:MAG: hypothetical protein ABEJ98_05185 [Candidatus Nanohaloarchaea archaeon]